MALEIFYTDKAKETLNLVYAFVSENFGEPIANKFVKLSEAKINLISKNPLIYKSSIIDVSVRIALINKHISLFYQVKGNRIYLLFFWDNRQEPIFNT
ncbi:MAG: hypothetical protein EOO07_18810 [Chitinophagaceae bacterium]|nr:MAG: hypothetical protein EOO07_18810 [Chitinophagaceae bacterium]